MFGWSIFFLGQKLAASVFAPNNTKATKHLYLKGSCELKTFWFSSIQFTIDVSVKPSLRSIASFTASFRSCTSHRNVRTHRNGNLRLAYIIPWALEGEMKPIYPHESPGVFVSPFAFASIADVSICFTTQKAFSWQNRLSHNEFRWSPMNFDEVCWICLISGSYFWKGKVCVHKHLLTRKLRPATGVIRDSDGICFLESHSPCSGWHQWKLQTITESTHYSNIHVACTGNTWVPEKPDW